MKTLSLMLFFALCSLFAQAQTDTTVYKIVEQQPEYPGGLTKFMAYMMKMEYPNSNPEFVGTVYIEFIVEKDGSVSHVAAVKSSGNKAVDETVIAQISRMPKWTPGYHQGNPVRVQYVVPIRFELPK